MKKLSKYILAMVLLLAGASAFATGESTHPGANPPGGGWGCHDNPGKSDCHKQDDKPKPPKDPSPNNPPPNNGGGGGTGYGGYGSADAAASAWQNLSSAQRAELSASLTSAQRQELMNSINVKNEVKNENRLTNNSPSSASSSSTGGTASGNGTGNTTSVAYQSFSRNLNLAAALSPEAKGDVKMGEWSKCGPRYVLPKDKDGKELPSESFSNSAHVSTLMGVGWKNIPVQTIVGPLPSFDTKEPVREVRYNLGPAMATQLVAKEGYFLFGHKMMLVAGVVSNSGASNIAAQGGSQGTTFGLGNSAGNGIPQVGAVIAECQIDSGVIKVTVTTSPPPTEPSKPVVESPTVSLILVEEKETVRPTGTTWRVGDACKLPGANCKKVEGVPGERTSTVYAAECTKPASPEVALRCAQAKGLLGKPPTVMKEILK